MNTNISPLRLIALVVAGLCFLAVLFGITSDVEPVKIVATGGLATLIGILL